MSELNFGDNFLELKELIKKIKWELTSLLNQHEARDPDYLILLNECLKNVGKISTNLNNYKRNIATLENYILNFEDMNSNVDYKKIFNIKINSGENDAIRGIGNFLEKSTNSFHELNLKNELMCLDFEFLDKNNLNILLKILFDLEFLVKDSKEVVLHFKNIIDNYRNSIKMIPIFESSVKKIEENLNQYIDLKKLEMDRYSRSLKNEFDSVNNRLKSFDSDFDRLKKLNTVLTSEQSALQIKSTDIKKDFLNFEQIYNENNIKLELKMDESTKTMKSEIYEAFNIRLQGLVKELDEVNVLIDEEVSSIRNTSKSFKDFISDETSIKLTNDYKNKAFWEMLAYYGFTLLSFIIIIVAIKLSWDSLSEFSKVHIGTNKGYTSLDLIYLSIRLIFSLIVFSSIAFTSRLASKSYIYWKKNEGVFLRLTALKSFIADMPENKKEEIHEKLVDVYFGKDEQEQNMNQKLKDLPNNITQLLGKVVDQTSVILDVSKSKNDDQSPKGS